MEALELRGHLVVAYPRTGDTVQSRLRRQMQADALQPTVGSEDDPLMGESVSIADQFSPDILEEVTQFLRLQVRSCCTVPGQFQTLKP